MTHQNRRWLGGEDANVSNARSRLSFSAYLADRVTGSNPSGHVGDVSGTVTIAGKEVGEVSVHPNDDDPVSTDYLGFDPSRFEPGIHKEVAIDGEVVGTVDIAGPDGHDPQAAAPLSDDAFVDDQPEVDPATLPGLVRADNEQGYRLAPALRGGEWTVQEVITESGVPQSALEQSTGSVDGGGGGGGGGLDLTGLLPTGGSGAGAGVVLAVVAVVAYIMTR